MPRLPPRFSLWFILIGLGVCAGLGLGLAIVVEVNDPAHGDWRVYRYSAPAKVE